MSTFQNVMYTVKYSPINRFLEPKVDSNYKYVQKNQTLIISASETTLNDMYPAQIKGQLSYEWICPEGKEFFCEGQYGENLYIPWKSVQ
jgi:hypothetical protein